MEEEHGAERDTRDADLPDDEQTPIPVQIQLPSWRWIVTLLSVVFAAWFVATAATRDTAAAGGTTTGAYITGF